MEAVIHMCSAERLSEKLSETRKMETRKMEFFISWALPIKRLCRRFFPISLKKTFQNSLFIEHNRANTNFFSKPLWDFINILSVVTTFLELNFDSCSCGPLTSNNALDKVQRCFTEKLSRKKMEPCFENVRDGVLTK